jgi:hypothetical protein
VSIAGTRTNEQVPPVDYSGEPTDADIEAINAAAAKAMRGQTFTIIDSWDKSEIGKTKRF